MTPRKITLALAAVAGLLGLAHLALSALIYPQWTVDALWFVGAGFAIVIGAAANMVAIDPLSRTSRSIMVVINAMMTGFFFAAWSVLPEPQVIVGGILFAGLAACAWKTATPSVADSVQ